MKSFLVYISSISYYSLGLVTHIIAEIKFELFLCIFSYTIIWTLLCEAPSIGKMAI